MAFSEKFAIKGDNELKKKWSFGRKTILICLFRNLQHNQSGARCGFESHRPPRDIRERSLGPLPPPPPRTPTKDFTRFFKTVMGRNLFSPETVNNSLLLYILTSTWKFIKHTICYSAKMFLFQKTSRLVAKIGAIYFLHVTRRNLTFSNISDKALAYLF